MSSRSSGPMLSRVLAVLCAALLFVGSGIGARPASAAVFAVTSPQELVAAFDAASGPDHRVMLAADITVPASGPVIGVPAGQSVVLDLNGFALDITGVPTNPGIKVSTTAALIVSDGGSGGTLTVVGGANHPGIGGLIGQAAGTITITGGTVAATGGEWGAGIGGSQAGSGGTVDIQGGTVTAAGGKGAAGIGGGAAGAGGEVTISGGSVTATGGLEGAGIGSGNRATGGGSVAIQAGTVVARGGAHAAGIGGGAVSPGADVIIGAAASVTAIPLGSASAVGPGATNSVFGSLSNAGVLTLPSLVLTIPTGVVVNNSGTIRNADTMDGEGTINNTGTIVNTGTVAQTLTVTGHNYLLQFQSAGGSPEPDELRVFAATLALAEEVLPAGPSRPGYQFTGWYLQQDASGSPVSTSTPLGTGSGPTTVPLYAGWVADAVLTTLTITPSPAQIAAGGTADFTVTGEDQNGQPVDVSAAVLTSSNAGDRVSGWTVNATSAGDRTITATLGEVQTTSPLRVTAAAATTLSLQVSGDSEVVAGTRVDLVVSVTDEFGNPVDASGVVISSSVGSDTVDGFAVTPTIVGDRTLTATLGELEATASLAVTAAAATTLSLQVSGDSEVVAGTRVDLVVSATDEFGNPVDASGVVISSSVGSDTIDGLGVTPTIVGDRTLTATLGGLQATAPLAVVAAAATSLTLQVSGETEVVAGTRVDLVVSATDEFGNPVDASGVVISSSVGSDTVDGFAVTPTIVGDRTLTATLGELEATASLAVTAAAATTLSLQVSGDSEVVAGTRVDLVVSATDEFGNSVDTTGVVITSSVATDVVDGLSVQFPTASPHVLTATLGDVTATITVEVVADTEPPGTEPDDEEPSGQAPVVEGPSDGGEPTGSGNVLPPLGSGEGLGAGLGAAVLFLLAGVATLAGVRRTHR